MTDHEISSLDLFFATTGAVGANVSGLRDAIEVRIKEHFLWHRQAIQVIPIRIVDLMLDYLKRSCSLKDVKSIENMINELVNIKQTDKYLSTILFQDIGDILRRSNGKDFLARLAIKEIYKKRSPQRTKEHENCDIFLIHSLKHCCEAELLRQVYRDNFFLFGAFMEEQLRKERWEYRLKEQKKDKEVKLQINDLFERDYERDRWDWLEHDRSFDSETVKNLRNKTKNFWKRHEIVFLKNFFRIDNKKTKENRNLYNIAKKYDSWSQWSQNIKDLIPRCDAIIHTYPDIPEKWIGLNTEQLDSVLEVLFGNPHRTPTNDEHGLFMAYSAMLQSGDLGRQVGAVITNDICDSLSIGYNEVPCFGGLCSQDNFPENRDYCQKDQPHKIFLEDLIEHIQNGLEEKYKHLTSKDSKTSKDKRKRLTQSLKEIILQSKAKDVIEHLRSVHAEMAAIVHAAKNGVPIKGGTLYVTTLPCHLCVSHIIAAGIKRVVYLEPYEKSKGTKYYENPVELNPTLEKKESILKVNEKAKEKSKIIIEHFTGILPNRYRQLFYYDQVLFQKKDKDNKPTIWENYNSDPSFRTYPQFLIDKAYKYWEKEIAKRIK